MSLRMNALAMALLIGAAFQPAHAQKAGQSPSPNASRTIAFNFKNAELTDVIETYSKASGQTFIVDPSVRGKVTVLQQKPVSLEEAFNLLATTLAVNGFSYSDRDGTLLIKSARNIQRDYIPTFTELPPLKPERMVTVIFTAKNIAVDDLNKYLRILPSKDGEMSPMPQSNKLIVTDYVSNLYRIASIIKEVDVPGSSAPSAKSPN